MVGAYICKHKIARGGNMMRLQNNKTRKVLKLENKTVVKNGIGFGSVLAITFFLECQSFNTVGYYTWLFKLVVCCLLCFGKIES